MVMAGPCAFSRWDSRFFFGGFYHVLPNVLWGSGVDIVCYTAGFIGDMGSHGGFWVVAVEGYSMVPNFGRL